MKEEMAAVALLWLVGCPVLCVLTDTGSIYGTPEEGLCGLLSYSISSSMTGLYPKVLGSIMAPLFAVLAVQRTSNGLCSNLKLGWLATYSSLVNGKQRDTNEFALLLWKYIAKIEFMGYFAGCCLIALVALDSKDFLLAHFIFATVAFFSLMKQNYLVGMLGEEFPDIFPNWSCERASRLYRWGKIVLFVQFGGYFILGTIHGTGHCDNVNTFLDSASSKIFGNTATFMWLVSVVFWSSEYAYAFLSIFVQLLEHYEYRLWEFTGETNMPYMGIVPRISIRGAVDQLIGGSESDADIFLANTQKTKTR